MLDGDYPEFTMEGCGDWWVSSLYWRWELKRASTCILEMVKPY